MLLMLCQYKFICEQKWITDSINLPYSVSVLSLFVNLLIRFDKAIIYRLKETEIEFHVTGGLCIGIVFHSRNILN